MTPAEIRTLLSQPWHHGHHHDLRGITCEGLLDLSGLDLSGVDFTGGRFPAGLTATNSRFLGLSWFSNVAFGGPARFDGACFLNDARFENSDFADFADFAGAEFRGIGRFDQARFSTGANFADTVSYGNFSLQSVEASGVVSLRGGEWLGGLWCQQARLPADTDLSDSQVHGRLWLREALRGNAPIKAENFGMSFGYSYN